MRARAVISHEPVSVLALEDANVINRVTDQANKRLAADHRAGHGPGRSFRRYASLVRAPGPCCRLGDVYLRSSGE